MAIRMPRLDIAGNLNEQDRHIKLFSGSRAAIQALNISMVSSQLVKDMISTLYLVGGKVERLDISWIKAHVSHPGNESADPLAREAIKLTHSTHGVTLPDSHFKSELSEVTYKIWADDWTNQPTCRLSKNSLLYPCKNKSKEILRLSRSQNVQAN